VPQPSAATLLRDAGLVVDGPSPWGRPIPARGPGVFVVELPTPRPTAPIELARVGKWIERVPTLRLDGSAPTSKALVSRLASFWLPGEVVLYVGASKSSVASRASAIERTVLGDRRPHSGGHWLHTLSVLPSTRLWWAETDAPEEYEDALLSAFADGVSDGDRAGLPEGSIVLPFANLRRPTGEHRASGITGSLLPDPVEKAAPVAPTRVVTLPDGEADGARDEAVRRSRPVPGRGMGRVAAAAGYAAQGSRRRAADEPVNVSSEGLVRLQAELEELKARRPDVVGRIVTAREHGDLKENAEYHAAREEQGFLEGKIQALEAKLRVAVVVAPTERGAVVELGSHVRVEVDGDETSWQVVGAAEADSRAGRISSASPVGAALMGRKVGDIITIQTPGGEVSYSILAID
jgi:transcription elongation factor GreA